MKATGATDDYKASLERQMELYLWLLSSDGPIAGGCTNSWGGQYQAYPAGQSTFHDMAYLEHPVYADPGSTTGLVTRYGQFSVWQNCTMLSRKTATAAYRLAA